MKPLLASAIKNYEKLQYPLIASPKLDGIRCLITEDGAVARSLKPIPNHFIRECLKHLPVGFDGEIITYTDIKMDELNTVQSHVMSREGEPNFLYHVFDDFSKPERPYCFRFPTYKTNKDLNTVWLRFVNVQEIYSYKDLLTYEEEQLAKGYEGVMLRKPDGPYKFGRSTEREAILLKVKRFFDAEAVIVGKVEQMENTNEAKKNLLGRTERSHEKAGMKPKGTLGALECDMDGVRFNIGTGLDDATRKEFWEQDLIGKLVTFKYQRLGPNGAPLLPVYKSIRDARDL